MRLIAVLCLALSPTLAAAHSDPAREARALDCAAWMYLGAAELERTARIDQKTAKTYKKDAQTVGRALKGNRKERSAKINGRMAELAKGKTSGKMLLEYGERLQPCLDEFLPL